MNTQVNGARNINKFYSERRQYIASGVTQEAPLRNLFLRLACQRCAHAKAEGYRAAGRSPSGAPHVFCACIHSVPAAGSGQSGRRHRPRAAHSVLRSLTDAVGQASTRGRASSHPRATHHICMTGRRAPHGSSRNASIKKSPSARTAPARNYCARSQSPALAQPDHHKHVKQAARDLECARAALACPSLAGPRLILPRSKAPATGRDTRPCRPCNRPSPAVCRTPRTQGEWRLAAVFSC